MMRDWYYAKAGQQQGPVTREALQEMIRNGSLDPEKDLVWAAPMKDWLRASEVAELGQFPPQESLRGLVQASGLEGHADENDARSSGADSSREIEPGSEPIRVLECISKGFELTKNHFGTIFLVGLVYFGILFGFNMLFGMLGVAGHFFAEPQSAPKDALAAPGTGLSALQNVVLQILSVYLNLGLTRVALNLLSGKPVEVVQLFGEGGKLLRALGASILYGLAICFGLVALIVPGIYLGLRYGQYLNAIVDKDMGVWEAFQYSSQLTKNNKWALFALAILGGLILMSGFLACGVGVIFTGPIAWLSWMVAYRWMQRGSQAATSAL
jgi:hypothetical protein